MAERLTCISKYEICSLTFCLLLCSLLSTPEVQAQQSELSPKPSHFVDVFTSTVVLPPGASLKTVRRFLQKKIMLRKEVPGEPVSDPAQFALLNTATTITAGQPLLLSQLAQGTPKQLAQLIPPHWFLFTVIESAAHVHSISLCKPYDRATLAHSCPAEQSCSLAGIVSFNVRVVAQRIDYAADAPAIVVLAAREADRRQLEPLLEQDLVREIACSKAEKYQ